MDIKHAFGRTLPDGRVADYRLVAEVAGVNPSTAHRWSTGTRECKRFDWISRLHAVGVLTDADLRSAGLAIPLRGARPSSRRRGSTTQGLRGLPSDVEATVLLAKETP